MILVSAADERGPAFAFALALALVPLAPLTHAQHTVAVTMTIMLWHCTRAAYLKVASIAREAQA
ncbi:hypothetical protein IE81DRAFT_326418 [Ceraceosorus guamensis]|uniref:Uncharacterized protein n=1 Tax=Ceraceosorus guamensis TaxID=1522189 RepID=A0A316VSZ8_9BASI|nr:hypothetical protein IE81DRAFT_326418 [Ceraceosorus guamensis]PWN39533.1 hypothetical protein IE81DRAFT_326418 [Ceraceosorus guamensis]